MHILVGLVFALIVFCYWLGGHMWARAIFFVGLAAMLAWIGLGYVAYTPQDTVFTEVLAMSAGVLAAWIIAAIPMFLARREATRVKQLVPQQNRPRYRARNTRWATEWIRTHHRPDHAPGGHP